MRDKHWFWSSRFELWSDLFEALRHIDHRIRAQSDAIEHLIETMQKLDHLQAEVARNTEVTTSAIALIQGLAAKIEELKNDPAALQALADSLKANDDAMAAAVTANTEASPSPAPEPTSEPAPAPAPEPTPAPAPEPAPEPAPAPTEGPKS
jgi:peptidoglycan hydrolase CwlO-like protein